MRSLGREFTLRGPWITRFKIGSELLGGGYDASSDERLGHFRRSFPRPGRVLELGCLEGGHTFEVARLAREVVAIDARRENLERARWLQGILQFANIQFVEADLESADLDAWGRFDVIFNVGLLYHLPRPWELLQRLAPLASAMFLWTHVAPDESATVERGGYTGILYGEQGRADPLSGMSESSFWPTTDELLRMLGDAGFSAFEILNEDRQHPHGPALLLTCRTDANPVSDGAAQATNDLLVRG
jgi:SAM-dependent methyltransferase